jgi:hypothetical protein
MSKPIDLRLHGVKFEDVVKRMIATPAPSKPAKIAARKRLKKTGSK